MRESLGGFVSALGTLSFIALLIPVWLTGPIGLLLSGAAVFFAALAVIGGVRRNRSAVASVGVVVLLGLITARTVYGVPSYFMQSVASRQFFTP